MRPELDVRAEQPALSFMAVCTIAAVALAVAMGIGRFAFTPLLPLMMRDGSTPGTIAIAALCVGSTFMVVTMIGMQEARARAPANPTALLGLMTAAFAIGQLSGPLLSGILALLPAVDRAALGCAMQIAAATLVVSAAYLWSQSRRVSEPASMKAFHL
jgi:hypothetical protein